MALDQVRGQPVGLPRCRTVADGDQVDMVGGGEPGQDGDRGVPLAPRLVRVNRVGRDRLARGVHHRDLDPGAQPRVKAHRRPRPGRRGEEQVTQVRGENPDRLVLGLLPQPHAQVDAQVDLDPGPPGEPDGVGKPLVRRPALVSDAELRGDQGLAGAEPGRARPSGRRLAADGRGDVAGIQGEVEHVLLLTAEHREDPVRRQPGERLVELEVVGELGACFLLSLPDPG